MKAAPDKTGGQSVLGTSGRAKCVQMIASVPRKRCGLIGVAEAPEPVRQVRRTPDQRSRQKVEINAKRERLWNSNWAAAAQAVNACAAVASSAYIALGYCEVKQLRIATGAVMPQNRTRSDLRGSEIQNLGGGMPPDPPSLRALRACSFTTYSTVFTVPPPDQCK